MESKSYEHKNKPSCFAGDIFIFYFLFFFYLVCPQHKIQGLRAVDHATAAAAAVAADDAAAAGG